DEAITNAVDNVVTQDEGTIGTRRRCFRCIANTTQLRIERVVELGIGLGGSSRDEIAITFTVQRVSQVLGVNRVLLQDQPRAVSRCFGSAVSNRCTLDVDITSLEFT